MAASANRRSTMTLYSAGTDYYSHRVRIVLAEKGITYELIDVEHSAKSKEELLEVNQHGSIPTLVDRDLVLYRSGIIMEYLDERFPHPPLMPVYPVTRSKSRLMMARIHEDWYKHTDTILHSDANEEAKNKSRKELLDSITSLIPVFSEYNFFLSAEFTLVDCYIAPLFWRLNSMGIELPFQAKPVKDYMNRVFSRESFQESLTEQEKAMNHGML